MTRFQTLDNFLSITHLSKMYFKKLPFPGFLPGQGALMTRGGIKYIRHAALRS